jgi:hypothetical protein
LFHRLTKIWNKPTKKKISPDIHKPEVDLSLVLQAGDILAYVPCSPGNVRITGCQLYTICRGAYAGTQSSLPLANRRI